jgi:hypothetical protein
MQIDLEKVTMNISPLTDEVFVGVTEKNNPNVWRKKKNVTNEFLACVIARWNGYEQEIIDSTGKKYLISLKEVAE